MSRLFVFTFISIVTIYSIKSAPLEKTITGKVTHAGKNTIDKGAHVKVELRDTSLMDAPSKLIASTIINDAKTFPVSYTLKYNPSEIQAHNTYSLSARISGPGDKLLYINDAHTRADLANRKSLTIDVAVIRVGDSSDTVATKPGDKKKVCSAVKCPGKPKQCAYGYQKIDGCEICKCDDPCNPLGKPMLCGAKQRCFAEKKPDGTFEARCGAPTTPTKKPHQHKPIKNLSKLNCLLPKDTGLCLAHMPRFYYNSATKTCEVFTYGGCSGNKNNFQTKVECEKACKA
ncbi:unnamed protein product [Rotaria magnacalcarata]|uniref:BPTI/Kunitz inhibitor domain-containing protein n=1 Tax=Rotaria magnacalcarata TaxID=392030 RepID=A0A816EEA0_9BILA|nr:unnamed protein product [Rotaria magnacalcarata]